MALCTLQSAIANNGSNGKPRDKVTETVCTYERISLSLSRTLNWEISPALSENNVEETGDTFSQTSVFVVTRDNIDDRNFF